MTAWERRVGRLPALDLGDGLRLHEARGIRARRRGLGRLAEMPADRALRLRCRAVHTFTMRFPIDLIWVDGAGRVVRVDRGVARRRHRACVRARAVVEVRAGCADQFLAVGIPGYTGSR